MHLHRKPYKFVRLKFTSLQRGGREELDIFFLFEFRGQGLNFFKAKVIVGFGFRV